MSVQRKQEFLPVLTIGLALSTCLYASEPPVRAPFAKGEDSLCVNAWWTRPANAIIDLKVPRDQVVCFGIYTVHNPITGSPLPWTGDYLDGFGNTITMVAYANPDRARTGITAWNKDPKNRLGPPEGWADGRGLVRFHKKSGEVTFECWPRFADVTRPGARQFPGWPVTAKP